MVTEYTVTMIDYVGRCCKMSKESGVSEVRGKRR